MYSERARGGGLRSPRSQYCTGAVWRQTTNSSCRTPKHLKVSNKIRKIEEKLTISGFLGHEMVTDRDIRALEADVRVDGLHLGEVLGASRRVEVDLEADVVLVGHVLPAEGGAIKREGQGVPDFGGLLDFDGDEVLVAGVDRRQLVVVRHRRSGVDEEVVGDRADAVADGRGALGVAVLQLTAAPVHRPGVEIHILGEGPLPVGLGGHLDEAGDRGGEDSRDGGVGQASHLGCPGEEVRGGRGGWPHLMMRIFRRTMG